MLKKTLESLIKMFDSQSTATREKFDNHSTKIDALLAETRAMERSKTYRTDALLLLISEQKRSVDMRKGGKEEKIKRKECIDFIGVQF